MLKNSGCFSRGNILPGSAVSWSYVRFLYSFFCTQPYWISAIIDKLFSESAKRYGFTGLGQVISVFVDFPVDFIKHFLPWTIFIMVLFKKGTIKRIKENRFVAFNACYSLVISRSIGWLP
jgi:hypothetical protein